MATPSDRKDATGARSAEGCQTWRTGVWRRGVRLCFWFRIGGGVSDFVFGFALAEGCQTLFLVSHSARKNQKQSLTPRTLNWLGFVSQASQPTAFHLDDLEVSNQPWTGREHIRVGAGHRPAPTACQVRALSFNAGASRGNTGAVRLDHLHETLHHIGVLEGDVESFRRVGREVEQQRGRLDL